METYSTTEIIHILKAREISLFTITDFARLFNLRNTNSLYKKISRLVKKKIIKQLIKGKYLFLFSSADDFLIANFLYQPSYISLESALSFYAIITGFTYKISSITIKKSRSYEINQKTFIYSRFNPGLFWGYEKKENFLIAEKEKALLDLIYLQTKGIRSADFDELDLKGIDKKKLLAYGKKFNNAGLLKIVKKFI